MKYILTALLLTCSSLFSQIDGNWTTFGGNNERTGYIQGIFGNLDIQNSWSKSIISDKPRQAIINDGVVYIVAEDTLKALNLIDGKLIWETQFGSAFSYSTPTYSNGNIYLQRVNHASDSQVFSINASNGQVNWKSNFYSQWHNFKSPLVVNGTVYINGSRSSYSELYGFDEKSGEELFVQQIEFSTQSAPIYHDGFIYTWAAGEFTKHDKDTGKEILKIIVPWSRYDVFDITACISDGLAYFTNSNTIFAINVNTMEIVWQAENITSCTPAASSQKVYVTNGAEIKVFNASNGSLESTLIAPATLDKNNIIISDDKLICSSVENTYIFDLNTNELLHTLEAGNKISVGINRLITVEDSKVSVFLLNNSADKNYSPIGSEDNYVAFENEQLQIPAEIGLLANDYDANYDSLNCIKIYNPAHGKVSINSDGSFIYTPKGDYNGKDFFYYQVSDGLKISEPVKVKINITDSSSQYVRIRAFQNDKEIYEGQTVTGIITGTIEIYNSMHQHAQFYKNFRVLHSNEHGHMITSNYFSRTFTLDTSEFYDGENLISVHAHPHNVEGQPYNTQFTVGSFKIKSSNENPAPNGDTKLPSLDVDESLFTVSEITSPFKTAVLNAADNAIQVNDDGGTSVFDHSSSSAGNAQVIPHLGASVLGRFRWDTLTPPFAEDGIISQTRLINFQKSEAYDARIVFFIQDEVGRANYAYANIRIPAISNEDRINFPLPAFDAHIENVHQGDTIIIPDDGEFNVRVKVSNPGPLSDRYRQLTLWVGNRAVKVKNLSEYINTLNGATEFYVDIPIPASEIAKFEARRELSQDSTAFALWLDFTSSRDNNLPVSEHIHLDSIRTLSRPWPFGPPSVHIISPEESYTNTGGIHITATSFGNIPADHKVWVKIDNGTPQELNADGTIDISQIERGDHTYTVFIGDLAGIPLENAESSITRNFSIINAAPRSNLDIYSTATNQTLNVTDLNSIIKNDSDLENDQLVVIQGSTTSNGSLSLNNDGTFTYIPNIDFQGLDKFTYKVNDGLADSNFSTVHIKVGITDNSTTQWQTYANGFEHKGYVPGIIETLDVEHLWDHDTLFDPTATVINNGIVYFIEHDYLDPGTLKAVKLNDGSTIWQKQFSAAKSFTSPTFANGNLYFQRVNNASDSQLVSVNSITGELNWKAPFNAQWDDYKSPLVLDGKVYINGGTYGGIYGFDETTGNQLFFQAMSRADDLTPSIFNETLVSWINGVLTKHNKETGEIIDSLNILENTGSGVVAIDSGLAFVTGNKKLFAIDLESLEIIWSAEANSHLGIKPSVANQRVYVISDLDQYQLLAYDFSGNLLASYSTPYPISNESIVTDDKLYIPASHYTYIFDLQTEAILETIDNAGKLVLSNDHLLIAHDYRNKVSAYRLTPSAANQNYAPIARNDDFQGYENETLVIDESIIKNDIDEDLESLSATIITNPNNGSLTLNSDGSFSYTPNSGFSGLDTFTYKVNDGTSDSNIATVNLKIIDEASSYIRIKLFKDGLEIKEGEEVSGLITGTVEFNNLMHQHDQLYKNFRVLQSNEQGHMIIGAKYTKTFTLDTSEFYDGENLISAHAHPHNVVGEPYKTDFTVGLFKIITNNNNPAPNGDTELPEAIILEDGFTVTNTTWPLNSPFLTIGDQAVKITDEGLNLNFDHSSSFAGNAQIIPHLGASVLGRFRWNTLTPPFAEDALINGARLINFQESTEKEARIVFFLQDEVGRANYAFANIIIPAISDSNRQSHPLPNLDATFENIQQGDTIIIPDDGEFIAKVKVANPGSLTDGFKRLNLWVGNRSVNIVDLTESLEALTPGQNEFFVDIPIPASEIKKFENNRAEGLDSTAFAIWLDFTNGNSTNLPTSAHAHVDSIRTLSRPWPFGEPTALIFSFEDGFSTTGGLSINAAANGNLPEGYQVWVKIDDGTPQLLAGNSGTIEFPSIPRGQHTVTSFITDSTGASLTNPEASISKTFTILNEAPKGNVDLYEMTENGILTVNTPEGVLSNDTDLEGDSLSAILVDNVKKGTLTLNSDGSFTYIPNQDFRGSDTFTYVANDGTDNSLVTTVRIAVAATFANMQTYWHTYNSNSAYTNYIAGSINDLQPELAWSLSLSQPARESIIHDGIVYFMHHSYHDNVTVKAASLINGEVIWTRTFKDAAYVSSLTYSDNNIYFQWGYNSDSQLYCLDASSGNIKWQAPFQAQWDKFITPLVENGKVYIQGGRYGGMYAFDQYTGEQVFFVSLPQEDNWAPAWYDGYVYTWIRGKLTKHDPETGQEVSSIMVTSDDYAGMLTVDQNIAIVQKLSRSRNENNQLFAVDVNTMTVLWEIPTYSNIDPSVNNGLIYVAGSETNNRILEVFDYNGEFQYSFTSPSVITDTPVLTDDKIYIPSSTSTYIFDIHTRELLETINVGYAKKPTLADGFLVMPYSNSLKAFKLHSGAGSGNHTPLVRSEYFQAYEDSPHEITTEDLIRNDLDVDGDPLSINTFTQPANGSLTFTNGTFTYTPNTDFSGKDYFSYTVTDGDLVSGNATVTLNVQDTDISYIRYFIFDENNEPITEGEEVSGTITGRIEIYNSMHQHAQFYRNFKVLKMNEHNHMVMNNSYVNTFTLDTSEFYDGENLLSAHVHPHNVEGQPYNTDFTFETFKLKTANNNPAPNGDTKLPEFIIDESKISVNQTTTPFNSAELNSTDAIFLMDEEGMIDLELSGAPNKVQVIPHLGSSVLGRFRWTDRTPPFSEREILDGVRLINFQDSSEKSARIIFFASDSVGRANYGVANITIPALSSSDRSALPLPPLDAHIENVHQGDTIIIPDGEEFIVKVKVTNPGPYKAHLNRVNLWVGNKSVNIVDISEQLDNMGTETELMIDIPIPASEITSLYNNREESPDSTAFALWVDFPINNSDNFPTSEHVHLNSIRTLSQPYPFGPPSAHISRPMDNSTFEGGKFSLQLTSFGKLPENTKLMYRLNNETSLEALDEIINVENVPLGSNIITAFLVDSAGTPLPNPEATTSISVNIVNEAPKAILDVITLSGNTTVPVLNGVLSNDTDVENDVLSAQLVSSTSNGSLQLNPDGSFTYSPNQGFLGNDTFIYKVHDGIDYSEEQKVVLKVRNSVHETLYQSWFMLGNDYNHSHFQPGNVGEAKSLSLWGLEFASNLKRIAVNNGVVYFFNGYTLTAVNLEGGNVLWEQLYETASYSPPTYDNGKLYFLKYKSGDSKLFSVNANDGSTNWTVLSSVDSTLEKGPTVANGNIYINSSYGYLEGYDNSGNPLFERVFIDYDNGWTPTYHEGFLYIVIDGTITKVNASTGQVVSSLDVIYDYYAGTVVASHGMGFIVAQDKMFAIDLDSMTVKWQVNHYRYTNTLPVTANGLVYMKSEDGSTLNSYDFSGNIKFQYCKDTSSGSNFDTPVVTDDKLILPLDNAVHIIDLETESLEDIIPVGGNVYPVGKYLLVKNDKLLSCYLINSLYKVTSNPSFNGQINVIDNEVSHGNFNFINVTADSNFQVKSILINGVSHPVPAGQTNYSFIVDNVTEDINIEAEFELMPLVTVNSGSGDGQYASGTEVTVTADVSPGQVFTNWSGDVSGLNDVSSSTAVLTVGASDAVITAEYDLIEPDPSVTIAGLKYKYYENDSTAWSLLPDFSLLTPKTIGLTDVVDDKIAERTEHFGIVFEGFIDIPEDGQWTFYTVSDDGSKLYINEEEIVDNDGLHGAVERSGSKYLLAGKNRLRVEFFERTGGDVVQLFWEGPNQTKQQVPASAFFYDNTLRIPDNPEQSFNGLAYSYYENDSTAWSVLPDFSSLTPITVGSTDIVDDKIAQRSDNFGIVFEGYLNIPESGEWTFYTVSDDGSKFYIGEDEIVNNDGLHGAVEQSGVRGLHAGLHLIKVEFFERTGGDVIQLFWEGPNQAKQQVPASAFFIDTIVDPIKDDFYAVTPDSPLDVSAAEGVLANDSLKTSYVEIVSSTQNGSVTLNADGSFNYTPTTGFTGVDKFTYQFVGGNPQETATVTLAVKENSGSLRDVYLNISGVNLTQLRSSSTFDSPDITDVMTDFEGPTNWNNSYATRLRSLVIAPETGSYIFYVAGDDSSELLYSTDTSGTGAAKIAYINGWTSSRQWDKYSSQKSAVIQLNAGDIFYLEALSIEGGGGDNLAAGWSINGGPVEVISNQFIYYSDTWDIEEEAVASSLPNGQNLSDIGNTAFSSLAVYDNGSYMISASGADIWGSSDAFGFVNLDISGDSELIARVDSIQNTNVWAKAGVMIRETLDANSKHAMSIVTPGNGVSLQRRVTTGSSSGSTTFPGISAPQWVRLLRLGSRFSGFYSPDGSVWYPMGSVNIDMVADVKAGLAVTSHNNSTETEAMISEFSVAKPSETLSVTRLILVNANTGQDIREITHNSSINLTTDGQNLSIRAETAGTGASVTFNLNGSNHSTSNGSIYALNGTTDGNYNPWTPPTGSHTILVTPFTGTDGSGNPGKSIAVVINVNQ